VDEEQETEAAQRAAGALKDLVAVDDSYRKFGWILFCV